MRYLLDTNVILRSRDARHFACVEVVDRARTPLCEAVLCPQVLIEYWVVATRPQAVNGLGLTPTVVEGQIEDLIAALPCLSEPSDVFNRWRDLVRQYDVKGLPAHDTRLVAVMNAHSISGLITLKPTDFRRYASINCLTPEAWVAANPK